MGRLAIKFGKRVKALRGLRGLSQAQLAEAVQVSEEWVRRIERAEGSPSFDIIDALAQALKVAPGELFGDIGEDDAALTALMSRARSLSAEEVAWLAQTIALLEQKPKRS